MTQNFLGIVDEDEPHLLAQLFRHVLDVPLVQTRQDPKSGAPDLSFVPHAAQGHAHERPAQGAGNALAEAGLAHAGRPDETEDRLSDDPKICVDMRAV